MAIPKRYGLSTLLFLMLVVAAVFGFVAWRTNGMRSEVARINREEVGRLTLSDDWFFPKVKDRALLKLKKDIKGELYIAEKVEPKEVIVAKFEETANQMRQLGANEIQILYSEEREHEGEIVDVLTVVNTDNLSRAVTSIAERTTP